MSDRFMCNFCHEWIGAGEMCKCGRLQIIDRDVDKSADSVDKTVDTVEISTAARLLHLLDTSGIVIVEKKAHKEMEAALNTLQRLRPRLERLMYSDITVIRANRILDEIRKVARESGWF